MGYGGLWLGLFVVTAFFGVLPNPLGLLTMTCPGLLYVIPVALCAHERRWSRAAGLIAGAALAAASGGGVLLLLVANGFVPPTELSTAQTFGLVGLSTVNAALAATAGLPIGLGTARGWPYARVVGVTFSGVATVLIVNLALAWDSFNRIVDWMIGSFVTYLKHAEPDNPDMPIAAQIDALNSFAANKQNFAYGFELASYLVLICIFVSVISGILRRRYADPGPIGSFRDMRPPDALVWAVIATALLWFADRHFGSDEMRFVSWNLAVALFAVYFLNGFAIFLYGVQILAPSFIFVMLIVFLGISVGLLPVLSMVGLFDTWGEFRVRVDRLAQAIRNAQSGDGLT